MPQSLRLPGRERPEEPGRRLHRAAHPRSGRGLLEAMADQVHDTGLAGEGTQSRNDVRRPVSAKLRDGRPAGRSDGGRAQVRGRGLVAHRRLGIRSRRSRRRRGRLRGVCGVGLQPGRQRVHARDGIQEATALRGGSLQVRMDALQAAALRGRRPRVRPLVELHRRAAKADRGSRGGFSARGLHVHRRIARQFRSRRTGARRAVHRATGYSRYRAKSGRGRGQTARRHRASPGSAPDSPRQALDDRDLPGTRARISRDQSI